MDTILIYDKSTGIIEGMKNDISIDLMRAGNLTPLLVRAVVKDDQGNMLGDSDVQLFDPEHGWMWRRVEYDKELVYVTTRQRAEVLAEEINDEFYPEIDVVYIENGEAVSKKIVKNKVVRAVKKLVNGKIEVEFLKRKRILEADEKDLIADVVLDGFVIPENDTTNSFFAEVSTKYKISVDETTGQKTLVKRG